MYTFIYICIYTQKYRYTNVNIYTHTSDDAIYIIFYNQTNCFQDVQILVQGCFVITFCSAPIASKMHHHRFHWCFRCLARSLQSRDILSIILDMFTQRLKCQNMKPVETINQVYAERHNPWSAPQDWNQIHRLVKLCLKLGRTQKLQFQCTKWWSWNAITRQY